METVANVEAGDGVLDLRTQRLDAKDPIPVIISLAENLEVDLNPKGNLERWAAHESAEDRKLFKAAVLNVGRHFRRHCDGGARRRSGGFRS